MSRSTRPRLVLAALLATGAPFELPLAVAGIAGIVGFRYAGDLRGGLRLRIGRGARG